MITQENALETLKIDLSVRSDNNHVGSGVGGNASELLFLLTSKIKVKNSDNHKIPVFSLSFDEITLYINTFESKVNLKDIRAALTSFITENFPEHTKASFEDLINLDFLSKQKQTKEIVDYTNLVQEILKIKESFANKDKLLTAIDAFISDEWKSFLDKVNKENNLSKDLSSFLSDTDLITQSLRDKHSNEINAIKNQKNTLTKSLFNDNDVILLTKLSANSTFDSFLCIRMLIGINYIVKYDLDEYFANINKVMEDNLS